MKNSLLIISGPVDPKLFLKNYNDFADVLALTPIAMLTLDILKMPYKTIEDYCNTKTYRNDLKQMYVEAEKVFKQLDKVCEKFVGFPYAYTGNILYFSAFLADIFYLEKLSQEIEKTHSDIYLLGVAPPGKLLWDSLTYSDLKTRPESETLAIPQSAGLENNIKILQNILSIKQIYSNIPYRLRAKAFRVQAGVKFKKSIKYIEKCIKKNEIPIFERWLRKKINNPAVDLTKQNIFIIQDHYEIPYLKNYMTDYNFINPVSVLRKEMSSIPSAGYDFNEIKSILNPFLAIHWPRLNSSIESLFSSYHREAVGRITYFKESFEELVERYRPKALLFSVGNRDVFDAVSSHIANKRNIPVIYFQHGGATIYFNNIYQKYVETNVQTKKTLILNSWVEAERVKHDGSTCVALGSMLRYQWIKENTEKVNDKIIYVCAPFSFYRFNYLQFNGPAKQNYQISRDIIDIVQNNSLDMDIKPHPIGHDYQIQFFNELIKMNKCKRINVICGDPIESIIKSYGLIIIDFLGSATTSHILSLKVPVILYLKDISLVNDLVLKDLRKRCYIVHDENALSEVINKFVQNNLPAKWFKEIIDRYSYPVANGDPGENIADYIKSIV